MTDEKRDDNTDDVEWLKNAFDRANQGDNGTVSETPRPAPKPFDESARRHDLDLDFETENFQPVTEFRPVRIPPERPESTDDPKTEALDALEIPEPAAPTAEAPAKPRRAPRAPRAPKPEKPLTATDPDAAAAFRQQLLMVAGGIGVVILALGGFLVGKNVGTPAPAPVVTPTAEPAPTTAREPGEWAFDQLFGGECITPFGGAWSETFTVVDCATEHEAQLVYAGDLQADGSYPSYPGDTHIGNAAMTLCQREGVLSLSAAKQYSDIVVSSAYPVSQAAWDSGDTRYYCFVSRAAGATIADDLAGSLVSSPAEAAPEPTTTP